MTTENINVKLTKKFIKGLQNYNLSYEDIKKDNWVYCGGDTGRHLNYFKLFFKDRELPSHEDKCVCGHFIKENCYITNKKRLLTLGNCCIKKFLSKSKSGRTCEDCGNPHRNRKNNKCNDCRKKACKRCGKKSNNGYKYCYNCYTTYIY